MAPILSLLPPPVEDRTSAVVLVHGAWVGEWSWLPVDGLLRSSGRPVLTVSLTGHGARSHQSGPTVSLSDHVADVVQAVETFDLEEITLVGHSYGGRVITQAVQQLSDRTVAMVFLDAHTPVCDDPGQPPERVATAEANGGMLPFVGYEPGTDLLGTEEAVDWFMARVMPQSFACFTDPWRAELPSHVRKTFVFATADTPSRFERYAEICHTDDGWAYHELAGPHWLMMSHPQEVAAIILGA